MDVGLYILLSAKPASEVHCLIGYCKHICTVCLLVFPGLTTHFGCIFHSPVAGFSLLVFEVS